MKTTAAQNLYSLEKSVPLPPEQRGGAKGKMRSAMMTMKVGDSFLCGKPNWSNAWVMAKQYGYKIVTRQVDANTRRIWRVK